MKRVTLLLLGAGIGVFSLFALTAVLRQPNGGALLAKENGADYTIIDIGTLGGSQSQAADLNIAVEIVGSSTISDGSSLSAFLWREGSILPLTASDAISSRALAINDSGQVVGTVISGTDDAPRQWPALWAGDLVTKLATISATAGTARAINNEGLIAGNSIVANEDENHLLLWQGESLTKSIPISGGVGWANAVNDAGQLVGTIVEGPDSSRAFLWQADSFTNLGTLGGTSSAANDINEQGQIVGSASVSGDLSSHAFLWEEGLMVDLGTFEEGGASNAEAINNLGMIVGEAELGGEPRAVMWQAGQIVDLNILLPPESEWERLISADGINDHGWIAGTGLIAGEKRAFLLKPQPLLHELYLPVVAAAGKTATPEPTPTMEPTATPTPVPSSAVDLTEYMAGGGRLYEVRHNSGSQSRHQTQIDDVDKSIFYHSKGYQEVGGGVMLAEWEELWATDGLLYRGTDTSPGGGEYYTLYEGSSAGSPWAPRYWKVGGLYERNPYVVFYRKDNCNIVASGFQRSWLRFENIYGAFTFQSGITIRNVIKLAWLLHPQGQPIEYYFYAQDYGLVGWGSNDRGYSYISEIHAPGQRPNNVREVIPCRTDQLQKPLLSNPDLNFGPLPEPWASRVK